jgi:DNA-binding NtrC family response regulator
MSSGSLIGTLSGLAVVPPPLSPAGWLEGLSPAITRVRAQILRAAPYFHMALLVGERDTGEEAVARMLHQLSLVRDRPFFSLTPADAEMRMAGDRWLDSLATTGMLYLAKPECLSLAMQEALLRLIRKPGDRALRVVAFSQSGLRPLVRAGTFSAKLANSLEALRITIPSLRDRSEDIPALLSHLVENIVERSGAPSCQLTLGLLDAAMKRPWLGNIIELESAAEGLMKRASKGPLHVVDLEAVLGPVRSEILPLRLEDVVQHHIRTVLFTCNGNVLHAAKVLGISRSTLYRMLK